MSDESDDLQKIIERVKSGGRDATDTQALMAAMQSGTFVLADGSGAVGVGGNLSSSQIVTGHGNVTGDRNIIIYDADAQAIQAALAQYLESGKSAVITADELVQQVRSRLHDDIQRLHGTMPLWGVDHWVPLGELFVDVNILEEVSSNRRSELTDLWQDFSQNPGYRGLDRMGLGKERQRVSGLEVLAKNTNLMVVGKPGSGKTTYLQRVVTECNAGNLQAHRIPVLIRLREFVEDGRGVDYAVERYLEQCWRLSAVEVQLVLDAGRSLVLLDGLDEVTGVDGQAIAKRIKRFARDYPQVQVIVTCRTQSQESRFERFDYVEVADFNEPQVRAFAEHWFQTVCGDLTVGQAKATAFLEQLFREENQPIRELAITPILLSLTCAVFQQKQAFYSKRSKLYDEGLELLLEQWDKSREIERDEIYRDLSVERKLELLSYLAVKKFEQEQYVLFEQAEIEGYIAEFLGIGVRESRGVLRAIESQHGLVIERAQKIWSFSHLTFHEYCVARWFYKRKNWHDLMQHITDIHWREVFLLILNMLAEPDSLLKTMKQSIDQLLASDQELQDFLVWLYQKSISVKVECPVPALKAFYLAFDRNLSRLIPIQWSFLDEMDATGFAIDLNFVYDLDSNLIENFPEELKIDVYLILIFNLTINPRISYDSIRLYTRVNGIVIGPGGNLNSVIQNIFSLPVSIDLKHDLKEFYKTFLRVKNQEEPSRWNYSKYLTKLVYGVNYFLLRIFSFSRTREHSTSFKRPNYYEQAELNQLSSILMKHRNLRADWGFDSTQKMRLIKYYDANQFLIEILNVFPDIHLGTRQEIESMILLPIAEIEKRKHEKV